MSDPYRPNAFTSAEKRGGASRSFVLGLSSKRVRGARMQDGCVSLTIADVIERLDDEGGVTVEVLSEQLVMFPAEEWAQFAEWARGV